MPPKANTETTPLLDADRPGTISLSWRHIAMLACACVSCFTGGTMYVYGVWGLQLKESVNLSQLQTNVLAGVIFSGGSFLTTLILKHASRTLRGAALLLTFPLCSLSRLHPTDPSSS